MPRFDFKCRVCGHVFEAITPSDTQALPCVACNTPMAMIMALADKQLCFPASIQVH